MITTITTVTTVTTIAAMGLTAALGIAAVVSLVVLLLTKELAGAGHPASTSTVARVSRFMNVAILPLALAFAVIVVAKLALIIA